MQFFAHICSKISACIKNCELSYKIVHEHLVCECFVWLCRGRTPRADGVGIRSECSGSECRGCSRRAGQRTSRRPGSHTPHSKSARQTTSPRPTSSTLRPPLARRSRISRQQTVLSATRRHRGVTHPGRHRGRRLTCLRRAERDAASDHSGQSF